MRLALRAWVTAKCHDHDVTVRPSDAGRRTALLTRMLGSRQVLVDLFGIGLLPALHALLPIKSSTTKSYADKDLPSTCGIDEFAEPSSARSATAPG